MIFFFVSSLFVAHSGLEPGAVPSTVGVLAALSSQTAQAQKQIKIFVMKTK